MYLVAGVAVASLTWGNLAALTQTNVKRLLAYSSISHVGFILLGLVAGNGTALTGISYYLFAYVFMTLEHLQSSSCFARKGSSARNSRT